MVVMQVDMVVRRAARYLPAVFGRMLCGAGLLCLVACAHYSSSTPNVAELPPLQLPDRTVTPEAAGAEVETPELLALTGDMRDFVDRYAGHGNQRQRLLTLHQSLRSPALLDIRYDAAADGTAAEAFDAGVANCLSYAHMFVALARYAGLKASYQSLALRPEWSRHGEQVALRRHVNVRVDLRNGEQYMVDIDPVSRDRIASAELLSEQEAAALFHANRAMDALLSKRPAAAYAQAVRALELAPGIDYLWVNLGAIYRQAGQSDAAEMAYKTALAVNPESPSAMNNLAVLYNLRGNLEESRLWEDRVRRHRERNPYHHYSQGEAAESAGDLDRALEHYRDAIRLKANDAEFYYRVARVYHARHQHEETVRYLEEAIKRSRLVGEREEYRAFLQKITDNDLARVEHRER